MPRGDNPNSKKNLKKGNKKTQFTVDNAVEMQKKSTEAKLLKKTLNESLKDLCTPEELYAMNRRLIQMAKAGNLNAYKLVRDGLGETPRDVLSEEHLKLKKREVELKEEGW